MYLHAMIKKHYLYNNDNFLLTGGQEAGDYVAQNYMAVLVSILAHEEPLTLKMVGMALSSTNNKEITAL